MDNLTGIGLGIGYVALGVAVLIIAKLVRDIATPYKIDDELTGKDNPALGLALTGYFLGVVAIFLGAAIGPEPEVRPGTGELLTQMLVVLGYSLGGIVLLNIGYSVVDRLVLSSFSIRKEIVEDRNPGTGAVVCGTYVATGLVVAGSIYGESTGPWWQGPLSAVVFFALGQVALVLFGVLYRVITKYDLHAEIERDNLAAGVAFGLSIIAIGVVLLRATGQDFTSIAQTAALARADETAALIAEGVPADQLPEVEIDPETGYAVVPPGEKWRLAIVDFFYYAAGGFVVLLLLRRVTDALLLPGSTIDSEISRDKNISAALIEGAVALGVASMVYFMI